MTIIELLKQLYMTLFDLFITFLNPFVFVPVAIVIAIRIKRNKEYKNSTYFKITKTPFAILKKDIGRLGEYHIYRNLKQYELKGDKFLFNVYIPKNDGETTEIDVLMISSKGIFVFESKNYSGWIFGSETQRDWCQTLPKGRGDSHKEHFYNPVMQNHTHIKYLKLLVGENIPMRSIIAFSDRCTLKSVKIKSEDTSVINRRNVDSVVMDIYNKVPDEALTEDDIKRIYDKLYPYTQVDETVKRQHVENIWKKSGNEVIENSGKNEMIVDTTDENNVVLIAETTNTTDHQVLKCPKCNCDLVLRTATRGVNMGKQFYGCSNYPNCKYTLNL